MLYSSNRQALRQVFFDTYHKHQQGLPLEAMEKTVIDVILKHPEYHRILDNPKQYQNKDYFPDLGEENPFLHMSGHIGLREQISTNRPHGIKAIYDKLLSKIHCEQTVEHEMMDCMLHVLFTAQKENQPPSDQAYLTQLTQLLEK